MTITISPDTKLLFIGDSITDCGRRTDPDQLGSGYVRNIRDYLLAKDPATAPIVINTGVGGNKITDLAKRWQRDVLDHSPDIVSIMIGINDVWHELVRGEGVAIGDFARVYRDLILELRNAHPQVTLILCEPTVIEPPSPAEGNEKLKSYIRVVDDLGKELAQVLVPTHDTFRAAVKARPDVAWTTDGVHPTSAGHALIARTWLTATGLL